MFLISPEVAPDGSKFQINAPKVWDIPFGDSEKDLADNGEIIFIKLLFAFYIFNV